MGDAEAVMPTADHINVVVLVGFDEKYHFCEPKDTLVLSFFHNVVAIDPRLSSLCASGSVLHYPDGTRAPLGVPLSACRSHSSELVDLVLKQPDIAPKAPAHAVGTEGVGLDIPDLSELIKSDSLLVDLTYINPDSTPLSIPRTTRWSFQKLNDHEMSQSPVGFNNPACKKADLEMSESPVGFTNPTYTTVDVTADTFALNPDLHAVLWGRPAKRARFEAQEPSIPQKQKRPLINALHGVDVSLLAEEAHLYPLLDLYLPSSNNVAYETKTHGDVSISTSSSAVKPQHRFPVTGEMNKALNPGLSCRVSQRPPAVLSNGVIKPVADMQNMWRKAVENTLHLMIPGYFHENKLVFYDKPPLAYCLIGSVTGARFYALEIAGKIVLTPVSNTFDLGSRRHEKAAAKLREFTGSVVHVPMPTRVASEAPGVQCTAEPAEDGNHYKFIDVRSHVGATYVKMHRIYSVLADADSEQLLGNHLLPARLFYGPFMVVVKTPFLVGYREAEYFELVSDAFVRSCVAKAVQTLAGLGLGYIDIRPPNVMVKQSAEGVIDDVVLIDYDDCFVTTAPIDTYEEYIMQSQMYFDSLPIDRSIDFYLSQYPRLFKAIKKAFRRERG